MNLRIVGVVGSLALGAFLGCGRNSEPAKPPAGPPSADPSAKAAPAAQDKAVVLRVPGMV